MQHSLTLFFVRSTVVSQELLFEQTQTATAINDARRTSACSTNQNESRA